MTVISGWFQAAELQFDHLEFASVISAEAVFNTETWRAPGFTEILFYWRE